MFVGYRYAKSLIVDENMNRMTALACTPVLFFLAAAVAAGQDARTQWDGVYTKAQSESGGQLYAKYCASCHGADLSGGELAPPLTGGDFNANWNDLPLGGLFERMRVSMPQNNPGSLGADDNVQILAYILSKEGSQRAIRTFPLRLGHSVRSGLWPSSLSDRQAVQRFVSSKSDDRLHHRHPTVHTCGIRSKRRAIR